MADHLRYADAFGVDRGQLGCWRYVYADGGGAGRPGRCPTPVQWAGWYRSHGQPWRVYACDQHLDAGEGWVDRAGRPLGR